MTRILAFAGSARAGSMNRKLLGVMADGAREAGAEVTVVEMSDHPMPLYDGDLESDSGVPATAVAWKELLLSHDAFLIAAPEYNSSITPLLKNAIDWASRATSESEPPLSAFRGKVAGISSASPGGLGGLRGLVHVRAILQNIGVVVVTEQVAVPRAHEAFGEDGNMTDASLRDRVAAVGRRVAEVAGRLA